MMTFPKSLALLWVLASALGAEAGILVCAGGGMLLGRIAATWPEGVTRIISVALLALPAISAAVAQWAALRRVIDLPWGWVPATSVANVGFFAPFVWHFFAIERHPDQSYEFALFQTGALLAALAGALLGAVQWTYLPTRVIRSWLWIFATSVGGATAFVLYMLLYSIKIPAIFSQNLAVVISLFQATLLLRLRGKPSDSPA